MHEMMTKGVLAFAAFLMLSCASSRPAPEPGAREDAQSQPTAAAPIDSSSAETRFIARHAALIEELAPLESGTFPDARAVEARAVMAGAEEMFLLGKPEIALELLGEAETALKRAG